MLSLLALRWLLYSRGGGGAVVREWLLPSWRVRRRNGVLQGGKGLPDAVAPRRDCCATVPRTAGGARQPRPAHAPGPQVAITLLQRACKGQSAPWRLPTFAKRRERIAQAAVLPFRRDNDARGDESGAPAACGHKVGRGGHPMGRAEEHYVAICNWVYYHSWCSGKKTIYSCFLAPTLQLYVAIGYGFIITLGVLYCSETSPISCFAPTA